MNIELYKKHRPGKLETVVGQQGAVASLAKMFQRGDVPHALLLTGPSGCGKTTIGRIVKKHLECGDQDYTEINSADFKGIDMVREIRKQMHLAPISGDVRIWLIDEAHKLTNDAQNALLKILEDTPSHAYFLLATTDPQKLLKTIHTRCSEVKLSPLSAAELVKLVKRVIDKEGLDVREDVVDEIVDAADGSARKALVILQQVAGLPAEEQLKAIQTTTFNKDAALDLARLLVTKPQAGWADCASILRSLKDEDPEGIRYCVLGYARSCLVGSENRPPVTKLVQRAFRVIDVFSSNFYDSKQAGLAAACYEVVCLQ